MAALPPAVGIAKVQWIQECSGRNFSTRVFLKNPSGGAWSFEDLNTAADAMHTAWHVRFGPFQDPATILQGTSVTDLTSEMGLQAEHIESNPGTFAGTMQLPINCQARVTWMQPMRYRGGKPGFNITGLDRTEMFDDRTILPAVVNEILLAAETVLRTDVPAIVLSGGSPQLVAVSYFSKLIPRVAPLVLDIIDAEVQNRLCTLRKRLGKGEAG